MSHRLPSRRQALIGGGLTLGLGLAATAVPRRASWAQSADARRLERRLELWSTYAAKTDNLTARYTSTRTSSLLHEPLVNTGALAFDGPDTLALVDDAMGGSKTIIRGGRVQISPKQGDGSDPDDQIDPRRAPGMLWLKDRLLACFTSGEGEALIAGAQAHAPRGRRPRIELRPLEGSPVRKLVRVVILQLDPVGGAVVHVEIDEAQGDSIELALADHRQNVDQGEIDRVVDA